MRIAVLPLVVVAGPTLIAVAALVTFVTLEASGHTPLATPPPVNVAEAVAWGDAARAVAFIRVGQDPNRRWPVREGVLDLRGEVHVTPVQAAILSRRPELVGLMLRNGARLDNGTAHACLSAAVGIAAELPPNTFGATPGANYSGPQLGGMTALTQCGLPAD